MEEQYATKMNQINVIMWTRLICVRFHVLTVTSMKLTAFWDIAPCSFVEVDRRFSRAYCLHHQGEGDWYG
jgi:hypothetical protein